MDLKKIAAGLGLLILLPAVTIDSQEPNPITVESFTLSNGLQVHLVEDHSSQVVTVSLWYDVGSRNEVPGRTGFAHLFEHMLFQGTDNVEKMEHSQLIERAGGSGNASTQPDVTNYYNVVPSNRLNLALWLEADRMRSLAVTEENLRIQKEAVKEERRLRVDNQPYMGALVDSLPFVFNASNCFAYAHSTIGSMDDLEAATIDDVRAFYEIYYKPNNATLVVAGDFRSADARRMINEYFATIPRGEAPPPVECAAQQSTGSRQIKRVADPMATLPAALIAYRAVPPAHADYPALQLLSTILGEGESSRLHRTLVRDSKVAVAAQSLFNPFGPMRGAGMFGVLAIANQGISVDTLYAHAIRQVLESANDISNAELTKAKNAWRAQTVFGRQQTLAVAEGVQHAAMFLGSPNAVNTEAPRYAAVTLNDLRRVARTYLQPDNSLILLIAPGGN